MNSKTSRFTSFCLVLLGTLVSHAGEPSREEVLQKVSQAPPHPRLFWTQADEPKIREKLKSDPRLNGVWESVRITADHMLKEPPVVYRKDGRRLLGRSREALGRMMHLGFAYRLTGDTRYAARALAEMKAMASMPDWNPSHFLDTAEMTMALATGYDWFYNHMSAELRGTCKEAIETKGLGPYLKPGAKHGWEKGGNNWNQVCHAGMVAGALALLEDNPNRAAEVAHRAVLGLPNAMKVYNPDGTYPEGPGYWNYGTSFNVMLLNILESALGTDFGLSASPGFLKTGEFMLNIIGPTQRTYPFSDCGTGTGFSPAMTWFAARSANPELLWFETELLEREVREIKESRGRKQGDRYYPLILVWARSGLERKQPQALNWLGQGQNPIATFRTSWTDPNATFIAVKAGTPSASHAHLDIGSFILDAEGERWSLDLGAQDYNRLELRGFDLWNNRQGSQRWSLFRYHNRGHSTLVVNDAEQVISSKAPISAFSADPANAFAVVDLSATYGGQLASATRRFTLQADRSVVIEDTLKGGTKTAQVRWGMVTPASLKADGPNRVWLELAGKRMRMEALSPSKVVFQSWSAAQPAGEFDDPNPGVSVVGFVTPVEPGQDATLKITLTPASAR